MKQSVNFCEFVDQFRAHDRYDQFGYDALRVLFDYFEEYEQSTGEEMELDVIAICCEYSVDDWSDIASNYDIDFADDDDDDEKKSRVINYINDNSLFVGECKDGIVYATF
jgi:hypothetical protein